MKRNFQKSLHWIFSTAFQSEFSFFFFTNTLIWNHWLYWSTFWQTKNKLLFVCLFVPFNFFQPAPSPTSFPSYSCKSVLCIYESISLLCVSSVCSLGSTYKWNHMVLVFLWLPYQDGFSYSHIADDKTES